MTQKKGLVGLLGSGTKGTLAAGALAAGLAGCGDTKATLGYAPTPTGANSYDIERVSQDTKTGELSRYNAGEVQVSDGYCTGVIKSGAQKREVNGSCPSSLLDQLENGVVLTGADGNLYTTEAELRAISSRPHDGGGEVGDGGRGGGDF